MMHRAASQQHHGRSPVCLPTLGLGSAPLGPFFGPLDAEQATATIHAALAAGVSLFDSAPRYDAGICERRLGMGLAGAPRARYLLATKVGYRVATNGSVYPDFSSDGVRYSLEESLARLGLAHIDLVHIHDPEQHMAAAIDQVFPALASLRAAGVIGAIGVGTNHPTTAQELARHCDLDCVLLAGRYTLLDQSALAVLAELGARGVAVLLGGIYNSGILATGPQPEARYQYHPAPAAVQARVARLAALCTRHGVPLHTAATQFPLAHPAVSGLIVGVRSPAEVVAATTALAAPRTAALWEELRASGLLAEGTPTPPP